MKNPKALFLEDSEKKAFDLKHRQTLRFNISKYEQAVEKGKARYADLDALKSFCANRKREVLTNFSEYLLEFEKNAIKNGAKVYWAETAEEAMQISLEIMQKLKAKTVVKSKSMTSEELHFNENCKANGIDVFETDLGEFIVQLAGEKPYHILTPAMHKSKKDVADLFEKEFNTPKDYPPQEITLFVREFLRKKYINADVGITSANFLIAETGSVALTENEGNAFMSFAFPKNLITIAGIEKLIPSLNDWAEFLPNLSHHGTGQQVTVYNSLLTGVNPSEKDSPESWHIILLDNGRSKLYAMDEQAVALSCIRCGACLNACPIYKNVGGYTYNAVYTGPIGSVISPVYKGFKDYGHLSFACSLCGRCAEVCSVKIPLPKILLKNRQYFAKNYTSKLENLGMKSLSKLIGNPKTDKLLKFSFLRKISTILAAKLWGKRRKFPQIKKSFRSQN